MEFSRAMLAASASVLGLLLYVVGALMGLLALVTYVRAREGGPPVEATLALALVFVAVGVGCRFTSRRIA